MKKESITDVLGKKTLIFDGATGTVFQSLGLLPGELPDTWNLSRPDDVYRHHSAYLEAGADIIKTNTFVTSRIKHENAPEIASAGAALARRAVDDCGHGFVAYDVGPTGMLMQPLGELTYDRAFDLFREVIAAGAPYADCILIETMSDIFEAKAAVLAAKDACELPVFVTFTMEENAHLLTGADIKTVVSVFEALGVSAVGFNCGVGPDVMEKLLPQITEYASVPVICNPNAGLPVVDDAGTHYHLSPDDFAEAGLRMSKSGASVLGGCCGTTPAHISRLHELIGESYPSASGIKRLPSASSMSRTIDFGNCITFVDGCINPSGDDAIASALNDGDVFSLVDYAFDSQDSGADMLIIDCESHKNDEYSLISDAIREICGVIQMPIVAKTSSPDVLARALSVCPGSSAAIINCSDLPAMAPVISKYGSTAIISVESSGDTLADVQKAISASDEYGLERDRIVINLPFCDGIPDMQQLAGFDVQFAVTIEENNPEALEKALSLGIKTVIFNSKYREMTEEYENLK